MTALGDRSLLKDIAQQKQHQMRATSFAAGLTSVVGAATARHRVPMLRAVVFDMDGTLTKPNLE